MKKYLKDNKKFWSSGYDALNVESVIFRLQGRILGPQFNLPQKKPKTRLLEFGCGQCANLNYFHNMGYDVKGVDISNKDIKKAKRRYPHLLKKIECINSNPLEVQYYGWESGIDIVIANQSLYYLDRKEFYDCINKIYKQMKKGAIIYASMWSNKHTYYEYSKETENDWLREIKFKGKRFNLSSYHAFFIKNKKELCSKFKNFKPIHIGRYFMQLEENETNNDHFIFIGVK